MMDVVASTVRILLPLALALGVLGSAPLVDAAHAGPNMGEGICVKAYNYADPAQDYLFASTEGGSYYGEQCREVRVQIYNHGIWGGYWRGPGIEGTQCYSTSGSNLLASAYSWSGYVSTQATLDSAQWSSPCSDHGAAPSGGSESYGMLWFMCTDIACAH